MDRGDLGAFVRRWLWLLGVLAIAGAGSGLWAVRDAPYVAQVRATVVLAGDTEIPGSSERPELMILDDGPALVTSQAFAALAHAALPEEWQGVLTVGDVQGALAATRYSRVLTITASRPDGASAQAIAAAAGEVLPAAVATYLVATGEPAPNVQVIDPADPGVRDNAARVLRVGAQTGAALLLGIALAIVLDGARGGDRRREDQAGGKSDAR